MPDRETTTPRGAWWLLAAGFAATAALGGAAAVVGGGALVAHTEVLALAATAFLAVAGSVGIVVRWAHRRAEEWREAAQRSARRADLLATVAAAGRGMTTADSREVLAAIADAARALGFDAVELSLADSEMQTWRAVERRGLDGADMPEVAAAGEGVCGAVAETRDVVEIADIAVWERALPAQREGGIRTTLGCPVWHGDDLVAVLTVARRDVGGVTPDERESVELLARQAGAALALTHQFSRQRNLERELLRQAASDALTGVANRTRLFERIDDVVVADDAPFAVLFLDLDGFKQVNDRYGHQAGDELLRIIAQRLTRTIRPRDLLGRVGGDEFAIVLLGVGGAEEAVTVAERARETVRQPVRLTVGEAAIDVSIGVAFRAAGDPSDRDRLLSDADAAMYDAKSDPERAIRMGATCAVDLADPPGSGGAHASADAAGGDRRRGDDRTSEAETARASSARVPEAHR